MAMGIIVTLLSTIGPARKAAKVAPLAAMRDVADSGRSAGRRRTVFGAIIGAAGVLGVVNGLGGGGIAFVGLGALATFVGVSMLAPALARPAAALVGAPLRGMGMEGVARPPERDAQRPAYCVDRVRAHDRSRPRGRHLDPGRVGDQVDEWSGRPAGRRPYIVKSEAYGTFSDNVVTELNERPEIAAAYGMRMAPAKVDGSTQDVVSVDGAALDANNPNRALSLGTVQGNVSSLADGGIAVWDTEAEDQGWKLGDTINTVFPDGPSPQRLEVIYSEHGATGNYLLSSSTYEKHYVDRGDMYALIVPNAGADAGAKASAQQIVDRGYPNLEVLTKAEFIADQKAELDLFVGLITALLGLAILIALLGVANTLALSIFERTREIGLLRAVGMTRVQLRRMVRGEAAVVAIFGALLGLGVGVFFGVAMVKALSSQGIDTLVIPPVRLGVVLVATAVLGVLGGGPPGPQGRADSTC